MSDCCSVKKISKALCPQCDTRQKSVPFTTLLHQVVCPLNQTLKPQNYFFCHNPECATVYFGEDGRCIGVDKIRGEVGQKSEDPRRPICYCFHVNAQQVLDEYTQLGHSPSKEFVMAKTKDKSCACEIRNPAGTCCLADFPKDPNKAKGTRPSLQTDVNAEQLIAALGLPKLNSREQDVALAIYRLLAQTGRSVPLPLLADYLHYEFEQVQDIVANLPGIQWSDEQCILAFMGLTTQATSHTFQVNGHTLYTWCAWDSLFIPQLLGLPAHIHSISPVDETPIELDVEGYEVSNLSSQQIHLSFKSPGDGYENQKIVQQFCCHIHFFKDEASGHRWLKGQANTKLMTLQEAIDLGKAFNNHRFATKTKELVG